MENQKPKLFYKIKKYSKSTNETIVIKILLADDCNNGHADFSITANVYEGTVCVEHNCLYSGCCHEAILRHFPEFQLFVDLHLSDENGCPMYAVENGFYHMTDKSKKQVGRQKTTMEYLRISADEYKTLETAASDKTYFHYLIDKMGLPNRWKLQAKEAIAALEKMTDQKWDTEYKWKKAQYTPLDAEAKKDIENKIKSGYYSKENITKRHKQSEKDKLQKQIDDVKKDAAKEIQNIKDNKTIDIWLLKKAYALRKHNIIIFTDNIIYYDHTKEICFNWKNFGDKTSKADYDLFIENITTADRKLLPDAITFQIK